MLQKHIKTTASTEIMAEAAWRLRAAQATATPCAPVRELLPEGCLDAAYRVQKLNINHHLAAGACLVGRKIGLTSPLVQRQLGVDQPDYGALLSDMELADGGLLSRDRVLQPKAEGEIAFILGADLDNPEPTQKDILEATAVIRPAIEIVGSRIANWDIGLVDTVADNASAGMFVLGSATRSPLEFDFVGCSMELRFNGEVVSTGQGQACMGNPLNAVAWLADRMVAMGEPLRAGEVILSGALGPMFTLSESGEVTAEITGLGQVSFLYEGDAE